MCRMISRLLLLFLLVATLPTARGFSLLGNFASWQTTGIGYNSLNTDLGGPMGLGEQYRWVEPTIYYAFDQSFLNYFGTKGITAINAAMKILNDLPPASTMSINLTEFPLDTIRFNPTAATLGILDIKSVALEYLMEELGLAKPERFTWTLRSRTVRDFGGVSTTNYTIINRNFDPVTLLPSAYVNSTLYTYSVFEFTQPDFADAVDFVSSANTSIFQRLSVAGFGISGGGGTAGGSANSVASLGSYYIGLTRDDAGGLRYLLKPSRYAVETLPPNSTVVANGTVNVGSGNVNLAWLPVGTIPGGGTGTGVGGPIVPVNTALRGGKNKLRFVRANYDSLLGTAFLSQTNNYSDPYVSNSRLITQTVRRVANQPDILFTAEDLGTFGNTGTPVYNVRTGNLISNDGINGQTTQPGPGVIQGTIRIGFTTTLPFFLAGNAFIGIGSSGVWGYFDGSDTPPVVFPDSISLQDLENLVLQGGN